MSESERIERAWDDFLVEADLTGKQTINGPKDMFEAGWEACAKELVSKEEIRIALFSDIDNLHGFDKDTDYW